MKSSTVVFWSVFGVIGLFVLILIIATNPIVTVGAGERGVVLVFDAFKGKVMSPGLNFRNPFTESVVKMSVQTQKEEVGVSAASKDLQTVTANIALNFHIDPTKVGQLYQDVGLDFSNRIISPAIQEAVKASTAKYTAEELITKRDAVKSDAKNLLFTRLSEKNIIVEDLSIVNFDFSKSFNDAIEAKVTAEQDALAAKNKLEQVKYEAQQKIETSKAEAEAIRIQASAINAQGGADYVMLQAIKQWNGNLPQQMIPGGALPFLNLNPK